MAFNIKTGDRVPLFAYRLRNGDNSIPDLTGASVVVTMRVANTDTILINRAACTITSIPTGTVQYSWATPDTANALNLEAEFEVTFADSKRGTYPNVGFISVVIGTDLG